MIVGKMFSRIFRRPRVSIAWQKGGYACTLRQMKVVGDNETATVIVSKLYNLGMVSIEIVEECHISKVYTTPNKEKTEKLREVVRPRAIRIVHKEGIRGLTLYFSVRKKLTTSKEAVELVHSIIKRNLPDTVKMFRSIIGVWYPRPLKK